MSDTIKPVTPKPSVASPDLVRPDWTASERRDPARLWLDKNENPDPELARVVARVAAAMPSDVGYCYPDHGPLYRKLAAWLNLEPANLILGAGSDGLIRAVFEAFVSPGDTVIHTAPTFAMYFVYAKMFGAREIQIPHEPSDQGPVLDADRLIAAIAAEAPRAVFLPNPDSPTGTVFTPEEMRAIVEAAGEAGAVMLVDEAYYPFHGETCLPWVRQYPYLLVIRSTGKAWGLAGYRIGYGAAGEDLTMALHKVKSMYEVGAVAAYMLEHMLDNEAAMMASVERLIDGKNHFLDAMQGMDLKVLRGAGNFLHVAFADRADAVHAALTEQVYYRKDFNELCLRGYSRFSAATVDQFQPVIDAIEKVIKA